MWNGMQLFPLKVQMVCFKLPVAQAQEVTKSEQGGLQITQATPIGEITGLAR
jgi:hypothetical protein